MAEESQKDQTASEGLSCIEFVDLMSDYIENELEPATAKLWDEHFEGCPNCADFFGSFSNSVELINYLETKGCPNEVKKRAEQVLMDRALQRR